MAHILDRINQQIKRLNCGKENDPYKGLTAEIYDDGIEISDDCFSGFYDRRQLLGILTECKQASLECHSHDYIWNIMAPAEI